jgi:hypothetical protein
LASRSAVTDAERGDAIDHRQFADHGARPKTARMRSPPLGDRMLALSSPS